MKNRKKKKCAECGALLPDGRAKFCKACVRKRARKQYKKPKTEKETVKIKKTAHSKPDTSQCRTCLYRGDVNVPMCDYLYITGHMRGCEPSPNCTKYVKCTPAERKALMNKKRQQTLTSNHPDEYQIYFNSLIRKER